LAGERRPSQFPFSSKKTCMYMHMMITHVLDMKILPMYITFMKNLLHGNFSSVNHREMGYIQAMEGY